MKRFSKHLFVGGICLNLLLVIVITAQTRTHAETPLLPQASSYSVLGSPTVSAAFINSVLVANNSPAAGTGQALFDGGVISGIDPVYALAFFMHESSFGTAGIARYTHSLGNLRCIPGPDCYDGFASFPTWEVGYTAWYGLIQDVYVDTWHLSTVEQIVPTYAPSSDHNNVSAYIGAVESAVNSWRSGQISNFGQVPPVSVPSSGGSSALPSMMTHNPYPADGYSIQGKPTVDATFINQILTQYHSPAAGNGQLFYNEGVKYGIDPIYALAFFMRDSTFGTVGLARATHSLGPIPTPTTSTCHCTDFHGYRSYTTWQDGITDWFHYMHDYYLQQMGLTTVSQIVSVYVTTNDNLAIHATIKAIEYRVDVWRKAQS
ncbi:MAG: glucosaminidase domain-containing protein [Ktedonobacteraceae bacterium]